MNFLSINNMKQNKIIDRIFEVGVLIKALFGVFELLAGVMFAISGEKILNGLIILVTRQEIIEDPNDTIANYLIKMSTDMSFGTQAFAIFYLLFHGVMNIFFAVFLLKEKIWAYPAAISVFGAFIIYQIYRLMHTHSLVLLCLIIFDIFIIIFVWLEYIRIKKKQKI
jgi:uncharacterized membrane protein